LLQTWCVRHRHSTRLSSHSRACYAVVSVDCSCLFTTSEWHWMPFHVWHYTRGLSDSLTGSIARQRRVITAKHVQTSLVSNFPNQSLAPGTRPRLCHRYTWSKHI